MIQYKFHFTEKFFSEIFIQHRAVTPRKAWRWLVKFVCIIGISALFALSFAIKSAILISFFSALFFFLFLAPKIDNYRAIRRFRKSPFYNTHIEVTLAPEGFKSSSIDGSSQLPWSSFTKYYRMNNGFLAYTGPGVMHWWPDSALFSGSIQDVEKLLEDKIVLKRR